MSNNKDKDTKFVPAILTMRGDLEVKKAVAAELKLKDSPEGEELEQILVANTSDNSNEQ